MILMYHSSTAEFLSSCNSRSCCMYTVMCHTEAAVFGFVSETLSTDRQLVRPLSTWHWVCVVSAVRTAQTSAEQVWPNIFKTSPHLVQAFMDSIEGLRVAVGPNKILQYVLQVGSTEICVIC